METSKRIEENWYWIREEEKCVQDINKDPEAGFNADMFQIGEKRLFLPISFRTSKVVKGVRRYSHAYKICYVEAKFCPFSGKPLYEDSEINSNH